MEKILEFVKQTGFYMIFADIKENWGFLVMICISLFLLWLGIKKKFEPLLLVGIAFGMLLTNLPGADIFHEELFSGGHAQWGLFGGKTLVQTTDLENLDNYYVLDTNEVFDKDGNLLGHISSSYTYSDLDPSSLKPGANSLTIENKNAKLNIVIEKEGVITKDNGELYYNDTLIAKDSKVISPGLIDLLYLGVKLGIYPCLIFVGIGAMTDFGPLISNPKSLLLGAAAQVGIFATFVGAKYLGFNGLESSSIGIIGGADGPTAIFVTSRLAPHLLGAIAVAAYSYMALVPVIQPPIMKLLTTKKERQIVMKPLRQVSKTEKIIFPIAVTVFVAFLVPSATPLVGCLMLGNLWKESGVCERLCKTAQNELMNIVTIFLGISVGATATASTFLKKQTLLIIVLGVVAFGVATACGVLFAKFMNLFTKNKINPLIGSAGVSAVPMAARVSQKVGQDANPSNFLLMHAMGPNVAGVIGSAIAAGALIALFG